MSTLTSAWRFVVDPLQRAEEESRQFLQRNQSPLDRRVVVVLVTTAVALTIQEYAFGSRNLVAVVSWIARRLPQERGESFRSTILSRENFELARLAYWAFGQYLI